MERWGLAEAQEITWGCFVTFRGAPRAFHFGSKGNVYRSWVNIPERQLKKVFETF
jgi:hypothetical protein